MTYATVGGLVAFLAYGRYNSVLSQIWGFLLAVAKLGTASYLQVILSFHSIYGHYGSLWVPTGYLWFYYVVTLV